MYIAENTFKTIEEHCTEIFDEDKDSEFVLEEYQIKIGKKICKEKLIYVNGYDIYSDSELFSKCVKKTIEIVKEIESKDKIDFIIGLGQSGCPLACVLSQKLDKRLLLLHERGKTLPNSRIFIPNIDKKEIYGKNVLLCDSILKSGYVACHHYNILKSVGVNRQYLITIIFNQSFFHKKIATNMKDLYFYPLFYWNEDFRTEFNNNGCVKKVVSNLHNNVMNLSEKYPKNYIKEIIKDIFYEIELELQKYHNLRKERDKFIKSKNMIGNLNSKIKEVEENNYDLSRFYLNQFLTFLNKEGYKLPEFLYSNYFYFSETSLKVASPFNFPNNYNYNPNLAARYSISDYKKSDIESFSFDHLLSRVLKLYLVDLNENHKINEIFVVEIDRVIRNLEKTPPNLIPLFNLFKKYCFYHFSESSRLQEPQQYNLEIFFAKIMYSFFEDLFYSKRYLKGERTHDYFEQNYISLWKNIKEFLETLSENNVYKVSICQVLKDFYVTLEVKKERKVEISEQFAIPKSRFFDVNRYFDGLFNLTYEFDEWRFYSYPNTFRNLLEFLENTVKSRLNDKYKNEEINFLVTGMCGSPIGYCLQQMLREDLDYNKIVVNFIDDKIFTPEEIAIKNNIDFSSKVSNMSPIFIFDSVIKNGFNRYYISRILEYLVEKEKISHKTPIYYIVIANYTNFAYTKDEKITKAFDKFENFKLISIYDYKEHSEKDLDELKEMNDLYSAILIWTNKFENVTEKKIIEMQNCPKCEKKLSTKDFQFFQNLNSVEFQKFKGIRLKENCIKYCDNCDITYLLKEDFELLKDKNILPLKTNIIY